MSMGFAPAWLRQVSPPSLLHKTTLTTVGVFYLFIIYYTVYIAR